MNNKNVIYLVSAALAVALGLAPQEARAVGLGTGLVFACTTDGAGAGEKVLKEALKECRATEGAKSACAIISGGTLACNEMKAEGLTDEEAVCKNQTIRGSITGALSLPGGWTVIGSVNGEMTLTSEWTGGKKCELTPKNNDGRAGKYVARAGNVRATVEFKFDGDFKVRNAAGVEISVTAAAGCRAEKSAPAYIPESSASCERYDEVVIVDPEPGDPGEPGYPGDPGEPAYPASADHATSVGY